MQKITIEIMVDMNIVALIIYSSKLKTSTPVNG